MRRSFLLVLCSLAAPLAGCATGPGPGGVPAAEADADVPPAFRNDRGELACPVMGDTVASVDRAAGHTDWAGKRYYFCCNSCEHLFAENPELYADGRYLVEQGIWGGGVSEAGEAAACVPAVD